MESIRVYNTGASDVCHFTLVPRSISSPDRCDNWPPLTSKSTTGTKG